TFELVGTLTGTTASGTPLPAGIGDTGQATISDLNSTGHRRPVDPYRGRYVGQWHYYGKRCGR
ncbi:hypothetical protein, partial [Pectobacterium parmentieri]|uniref:hypothetical protein n=1 Tax=Pectobacterium parmentieri TaxID=1905730 RepID=UPI000D61921A